MLEREITDASFVMRWGIVRTLRKQSIAEHSFNVAMYANDIANEFDFTDNIKLAVVQYALWHDMDEIFTGDLPGPNKRALLTEEAKKHWSGRVYEWTKTVFKDFYSRNTVYLHIAPDEKLIKLVVKIADWIDAAVFSATEVQMGNKNFSNHIKFNADAAVDCVLELESLLNNNGNYNRESIKKVVDKVIDRIRLLVHQAEHGNSAGPLVSGEHD